MRIHHIVNLNRHIPLRHLGATVPSENSLM